MSSKELIHKLFDNYTIVYRKSDSYEKLVGRLVDNDYEEINLNVITIFNRENWNPTPTQLHLENLKSGLLTGHGNVRGTPTKINNVHWIAYEYNDLDEINFVRKC